MKFRHEIKYLINYCEYTVLRTSLDGLLKKDPHVVENGFYNIRSLYFDDLFNTAYREKEIGIKDRSKYRIRIYNHSNQLIKLERKIKSDKYIFKQSAPLEMGEVISILNKDFDFLLESDHTLHNIFYHQCRSSMIRPRVIIDYEREPYILDAGQTRITFDKNVRAGFQGFDIFDEEMPMMEVLDPGYLIMEVKYTEFLPALITELFAALPADRVAVSKYVLGCEKAAYKKFSYY
jgi:hypothetical protein